MRIQWRSLFRRKRIGAIKMINELEIQKAVLKSINTQEYEFKKTIGELSEELTEYIDKHNLNDRRKRENIAWQVQGLLEKALYEHGTYDNFPAIIHPVVEKWNAEQLFQLSYDSVETYLIYLFKSTNMRKAYIELCEGDVQSYKAFAHFSDGFMDYLLRAIFVLEKGRLKNIHPIAVKVFNTFFQQGNANKEYGKSLKRLGVSKKSAPDTESSKPAQIVSGKAASYGNTMRMLDLPIIKGFNQIFKQVIEIDPMVLKEEKYVSFFKQYIEPKPSIVATTQALQEKSEVAEFDLFNPNQPVVANTEEFLLVEDNVPVSVSTFETIVDLAQGLASNAETIEETEFKQYKDEEKEFLSQIDEIIARLQASKTTATAIFAEKTVTSFQVLNGNIAKYEERFVIAEEEISRLHRMVEEEREKVATIEEISYKKLVDAIAGSRSNYLLSELYRESLGESTHSREIVQGQLMNLFNQFNMAIGLDLATNGHQIGDEFDLTRHELAHDYRVLNEVQTQGNQIRVQLMQYGWTLNGKVVVQPLIKELKGAN